MRAESAGSSIARRAKSQPENGLLGELPSDPMAELPKLSKATPLVLFTEAPSVWKVMSLAAAITMLRTCTVVLGTSLLTTAPTHAPQLPAILLYNGMS